MRKVALLSPLGLRRLAIVCTIVGLGIVPVEETLWRDGGACLASPAGMAFPPSPGLPDGGQQQDEEPFSDPVDDDLPESLELAGWEALPRRCASETELLLPPGFATVERLGASRNRALRCLALPADPAPGRLCTRLCRLTC